MEIKCPQGTYRIGHPCSLSEAVKDRYWFSMYILRRSINSLYTCYIRHIHNATLVIKNFKKLANTNY